MSAREAKLFVSRARALLRRIAAYVASGGNAGEATATEIKIFDARWKLENAYHRSALEDHEDCARVLEVVAGACKTMGDQARETRAQYRSAESARLDALEKERTATMGGYAKELAIMRGARK